MNVAMEENVGQTKGFERALEGLGSEPTQGTIPPIMREEPQSALFHHTTWWSFYFYLKFLQGLEFSAPIY